MYVNTKASFDYSNGVYTNTKAAFDYANGVYTNTAAAFAKANTGGVSITDDTATAATYYPVVSQVTTGSVSTLNTSSTKLTFNPSTGTLSATVLNTLSDKELKINVEEFDGPELLKDIHPITFQWKDNKRHSFGVIAQEFEIKFPDLVDTQESGLKSVSYIPLIAILIDTVKKQQIQLNRLNDEIERIKNDYRK